MPPSPAVLPQLCSSPSQDSPVHPRAGINVCALHRAERELAGLAGAGLPRGEQLAGRTGEPLPPLLSLLGRETPFC